MTYNKFRRTLRNAGWSCYLSYGIAYFSRGRASIEVYFDDNDYGDGYFYWAGDFIAVEDLVQINLFSGGLVLWHVDNGGYQICY